jgi:uridine phosphorylase
MLRDCVVLLQGRTGGDFDDRNVDLIDLLRARFPSMVSLEMETFHLLDLARCSRGGVKAAGMCLAVAERASNAWLDHETLVRSKKSKIHS